MWSLGQSLGQQLPPPCWQAFMMQPSSGAVGKHGFHSPFIETQAVWSKTEQTSRTHKRPGLEWMSREGVTGVRAGPGDTPGDTHI